jgi:hypothetical protein
VTIAAGAVTLVLKQVLVASFQQSGHGGEALTITAGLEGATRELR